MLRALRAFLQRDNREPRPSSPPRPSRPTLRQTPPPRPSQASLAAELVRTNTALVEVVHGYQQLLTMMTHEAFRARHQVHVPEEEEVNNTQLPEDAASIIYVLQLRNHQYHAGKTKHLLARFRQHEDGEGAAWTRRHKPVRIIATYPCTVPGMENAVVKLYMSLKGMDHVRGGAYSNDVLTDDQKRCIQLELMHDTNKCFRCNTAGHYMRDCPQQHHDSSAPVPLAQPPTNLRAQPPTNLRAQPPTNPRAEEDAANPDAEELYFWK